MKRIIQIFLIIFLEMILIVRVHAIDITTSDTVGTVDVSSKLVTNMGNLTVTGVSTEDTFLAYKIIDTFYSVTKNTITYEFNSVFKDFLNSTTNYKNLTIEEYLNLTSGSITSGSTVTDSTLDVLISKFAEYIKTNNIDGFDMSVSGSNASASLQVGSYLVLPKTTSKVYAVMVGNIELRGNENEWTLKNSNIVAKVSDASITKVIKDNLSTEGKKNINEEYSYVINASVPIFPTNATNKTLIIIDKLDEGIDFIGIDSVIIKDGDTNLVTNSDGTVKDNDGNIVATITVNDNVITFNFNAEYIETNNIEIEYKAKLNENLVLGNEVGNKSITTMTYATEPYALKNSTTDEVINTIYSYGVKLFKHDNNNIGLQNAIYKIYLDSELNNEVGIITTGSDGYGKFSGLKDGIYYLKEVKAPAGYKINNELVTLNVDGTKQYEEVNVVDEARGLLPSAGGIGVYIYIITGAVLIIGALIILLFNKGRNNE